MYQFRLCICMRGITQYHVHDHAHASRREANVYPIEVIRYCWVEDELQKDGMVNDSL